MRALFALCLLLLAPLVDARVPGTCACNGLKPAAEPIFSPVAGTYASSQSVTLATTTGGAAIYYTTDGTTPTMLSTLYTGAITVSTTETIKAIATAFNFNQSPVGTALFTIETQASAVVFTPVGGTYSSVNVTLSDTTPGAVIHYNTSGSPNCSSTTYTTPIAVGSTETIYAIACASGYTNSVVGSQVYTISGGGNPPCATGPSSSGLVVNAVATRSSGIEPLLVFFDATGTTDSNLAANVTSFQDDYYSWNFGDSGLPGTGKWVYGANAGNNSMNTATGATAAHMFWFLDGAGDTSYTATLTVTNGTQTVACTIPVTALDPTDGSGAYSATTCFYNSTLGSGCPSGATHTSTLTIPTLSSMSGKRYLFKCGDTFTGNEVTINGQIFQLGAYGSCVGTQIGRPIFHDSGTGGELILGSGSSYDYDGRITDLDLEGPTLPNGATAFYTGSNVMPFQILLWNVNANNHNVSFLDYNVSQLGLVQFTQQNQSGTCASGCSTKATIGTYINSSENQCVNGNSTYACAPGTQAYVNVNYNAILGSSFNGTGSFEPNSNGVEVVRISACRLCVFENSTFENANTVGATFKLHNGQPNSQANWIGQYTELIMVTDNLFTGQSGGQIAEIAPQNNVTDERLQNIVFERNLVKQTSTGSGKVLIGAMNASARDNVVNSTGASGSSSYGIQVMKRGYEYTHTAGAPVNSSAPQYAELYNNTCYGAICMGLTGANFVGPANNSWCMNTMMYSTGGGSACTNAGAGNTVSHNTSTVSNNPSFTNGGGAFNLISDYKPTANYSGGTTVPNLYDALGVAWSGTWDLGAIHH